MPNKFLNVIIKNASSNPALLGLCAGYELGEWRAEQLAEHLCEWLPEFCLTWSEINNIGIDNCVRLIRQAAKRIYNTGKFKGRGEFGEVLLHSILRMEFNTIPAISKIYYKDSNNDTVKGFDAVHIINDEDSLQLWLGEVKFYKSIHSAIRDVIEELKDHTNRDYLRDEFIAITNKMDSDWPFYDKLNNLLDPNTSLDTVFDCTCIPVLLTYDSETTESFSEMSEEYKDTLQKEMEHYHKLFSSKDLPENIEIHLILVPLKNKDDLNKNLNEKLSVWQRI